MAEPLRAPRDGELLRRIGLYAATAITVGNIIGSGIFRSPHSVAQHLHSFPVVLFAWVLGGVLSICGSLVLTELVVTHPHTGGLYVFIREAFGDAFGFVFGWANLWVIKPTVIASITSVFALYFCQVLHLGKGAEFPVGAIAILLLTFINGLGVREGAGTQSLFTTLKVIGIAGLCLAAFLLPATHPASPASPEAAHAAGGSFFQALALAMISILFAYDGWTDSTYVAGEIVAPQRTMPVAIVQGTWLVIAVYVLTNMAYFHVLGADGMAQYEAVGSETIRRLLGEWGARALAVLVAVSTFGTTNGAILTGPRVTQAMAADGLLWRPLAALDPRRGTPTRALWVQAVLSCLWLWCARGFEDVSGWFVTTSWLFYGLTTAAVFVYRRHEREGRIPAPVYRTPLFPLTPLLFISVTVMIIASDLHDSGWRAAAGVAIAAAGFPVYWLWKGRRAPGDVMAYTSPYVDPALYDVVYQKVRDDLPFYLDLALRAGGPVLELGCGTGRVLLPTLEAGVAIEGLDLDGGMLDALRSKARARGLTARVYRGDMRDFTMPGRYRLITIPFRAFLHLLSTEEQLQALHCAREHLEPGGLLALNVFYPTAQHLKSDDGVRRLSIDVPHPVTGHRVAVFDVSRHDIVQQQTAVEREIVEHDDRGPARATNVSFTLRWVYRWELELLLVTAGFGDVEIFGGFDRRRLEHDTDEMVVLARRK